jgi:ribonuclease P protein component
MPYAYRKSERLKKNSEFTSVMKGKRLSYDGLSLFYTVNGRNNFRIGISVGKKLTNAVKRNRLKRQIRSCIMSVIGSQALGYDLVFVARKELKQAEYERIHKIVERILMRSILSKPQGTKTVRL